jgi:hypothetical protein
VIAISKEELMRKLIATIAAASAFAFAAVGLATHTATSDAPAYATSRYIHMLPYVEQDSVYRAMDV